MSCDVDNSMGPYGRAVILAAVICSNLFLQTSDSATANNLVTNGSFEEPAVVSLFETYYGVDAASLPGWVVDVDGTSVNHDGTLWVDADGSQSIDMNGLVPGSLYQDIATTASQKYVVRFALAGNPYGFDDKRIEVLWDGALLADLTFQQAGFNTFDMGWIYYQFVATASDSSTRLTFNSLSGVMQGVEGIFPWYGPAIDDVSVEAVPEPSIVLLASVGALSVVFFRRRLFSPNTPPRHAIGRFGQPPTRGHHQLPTDSR